MTQSQYRPVEKQVLNDIDMIHHTPQNNIHDKPTIVFRFKKQTDSSDVYCRLSKKWWLLVKKNPANDWEFSASIVNTHVGLHVIRETPMIAWGNNRPRAVARLMGIHCVYNEYTQRNLNLYEMCNPHLRIPGHHNKLPATYVETHETEAIRVLYQWLTGEVK